MVEQIRTSEDHNGDGTGLPPFPRRHTEIVREDFTTNGAAIEFVHELGEETSAVEILYVPSSAAARLYGPAQTGVSRIIPHAIVGRSVLGSRELLLRVTGHDVDTSFDIDIWEY